MQALLEQFTGSELQSCAEGCVLWRPKPHIIGGNLLLYWQAALAVHPCLWCVFVSR